MVMMCKQLMEVIDKAHHVIEKPVMIIAKTIKGYGIESVAGLQGFHGKAFTGEKEKEALQELEKKFPRATAV